MWEEPRPERIRDIESRRRSSAGRMLLGIAIVLGLVGILLKSQLVPPLTRHGSPPSEVEPADERPSSRSPSPEEAVAPSPSGAPVAARSASKARVPDPQVLQRLAETCRYWTEQNTRGQYDGHQEMACNDMASYASQLEIASDIANSPRPIQSQTPGSPSVTTRQSAIYVDQCDRHSHGSIEYRRCRAREKQRLSAVCQELREQLPSAQGSRYQLLTQRAQAACREADRYEIVR